MRIYLTEIETITGISQLVDDGDVGFRKLAESKFSYVGPNESGTTGDDNLFHVLQPEQIQLSDST